jgi:hypothetical protein
MMTNHRTIGTTIGPLLLCLLFLACAAAYQPSHQGVGNRRDYLAGLLTATTAAWVTASAPANAVLGSGACASGVGEGCEDRSEGNAYIVSLQEKSAVNKDMYAQVRMYHAKLNQSSKCVVWCGCLTVVHSLSQQAREAYYMKNYPDFFATVGKTLVKKTDGTFMIVDDSELEELKRANKLTIEIPKAMGGRVTDLTQKPVLIMREWVAAVAAAIYVERELNIIVLPYSIWISSGMSKTTNEAF